jgi:Outer membrane efflux protein
MMALNRLTVASISLVGLSAILTAGGLAAVAARGAQHPRPAVTAAIAQSKKPDGAAKADEHDELDVLMRQMIEVARSRFDNQRQQYELGRLTIDRYIDACEQLKNAELSIAKSQQARNAIRRHYLTRLKDIETREKGNVDAGQAAVADLDEIRLRRLQVEIELKTASKEEDGLPMILKRLTDLERKVEQLEKRAPAPAGS